MALVCTMSYLIWGLPSSLYESLKLRTLLKFRIVIQLTDHSNSYPKGVVENVLVKVNDLIFLADFFILDMEKSGHAPILLGRPFVITAQTIIDVSNGALSIEFEGERAEFKVNEKLSKDPSLESIKVVNDEEYPLEEYYPIDGPYESLGVDLSTFSLESPPSSFMGHVGVVEEIPMNPSC